jgi:hypothetical protein
MKLSTRKLRYRLRVMQEFLRRGFKLRRIVFYPDRPGRKSVAFRICSNNGIKIINRLSRNADAVFFWQDATRPRSHPELEMHYPNKRIINLHCTDISKSRIEQMFERAFGYPLSLDPTQHQGPCLKKSDQNATHDGEIVDCPIKKPLPGFVYQRLVDNRLEDGELEDLRIPVFRRYIPLVFKYFRTPEHRFGERCQRAELFQPQEVMSDQEISNLLQFCQLMGMDYGELDVLRDRQDGRIYVVDANSTPLPPHPDKFDRQQWERINRQMYHAFAHELCQLPH